MEEMPNAPEPDDDEGYGFDFPAKALVDAARSNWALIVIVWVTGGALAGTLAFYSTLRQPVEHITQVEFGLVTNGVVQGRYPNGTLPSTGDLLVEPVLKPVYERNTLDRYLTFAQFRSALNVLESNPSRIILDSDYQARLADNRLTGPERTQIEAEYRQRLANLRRDKIILRFMVSGQAAPPAELMEKVLDDILAQWAERVTADLGVMGYDLELMSPRLFAPETSERLALVIRLDRLRQNALQLLRQIDALKALPGAATVRVGEDRVTLSDLRSTVLDVVSYQLAPAVTRGLSAAMTAEEADFSAQYLLDRIGELEHRRNAAVERKQQLEAALRAFNSSGTMAATGGRSEGTGSQERVTPQLTDAFLSQLMDITSRSMAVDYRTGLTDRILATGSEGAAVSQQLAFYQDALRRLRAPGGRGAPAAEVVRAVEQTQAALVEALTLSNEVYRTLSENLTPGGRLYQLSSPFSTRTLRAAPPNYSSWVGLFLAGGVLLAVGVAGASVFRRYRLS